MPGEINQKILHENNEGIIINLTERNNTDNIQKDCFFFLFQGIFLS